MKSGLSVGGYPYINFRISIGVKRNLYVHRLLALAFIPNPENKPEVNHKNGVKTDNSLDNLEWMTKSENELHAFRTGLKANRQTRTEVWGGRWGREIHTYLLDGETFQLSRDAATHFSVAHGTILARCKSPNWPTWSKTVEFLA